MDDKKDEFTKVSLYIRKEEIIKLRKYVVAKYGQLKGFLGYELSNAIKHYLDSVEKTQTQENEHIKNVVKNPSKKHIQLLIELVKKFTYEVTHFDLESLIEKLFGIDVRTKRKYTSYLVDSGFLKLEKVLQNKNIIYKVDYKRIYDYLRNYVKLEDLTRIGILPYQEAPEFEQKMNLTDVKIYARERYEAGDSIEEISDKIEEFGTKISKKEVRNLIRSS
ncbi:MAG: hypothetical protein QXY19_02725 [Archaeoglobaceae archaeon]